MNTDEFEGHTPGSWWIENGFVMGNDPDDAVLISEVPEIVEGNEADAHLLLAAPDLLAEVKRLTQLNYEQRVEIQRLRDAFGGVERMVENVRGVFE